MGEFSGITPIGSLGRTDQTVNAANQANDHNTFQAKIDALIEAGSTLETETDSAASAQSIENGLLQQEIVALQNNATLATLAEPVAGLAIPAGSLEHFWGSGSLIRRLITIGDSTEQQTTASCSFGQGGKGTSSELLAVWLSRNYGTLLSPGLRPIWYGGGATLGFGTSIAEYALTSAGPSPWAAFSRSTAGDVAPFGRAITATGVGNIAKWTAPTLGPARYWGTSFVGTEVLYIDAPGTNLGSIRFDGGTWVAITNQQALGDNKLKAAYVGGNFSSTVEVRAGNASGTGGTLILVGVRPYWIAPSGRVDGFYVDNIGHDGNYLSSFVNSASTGDPLAFINNIGGATASSPPPVHVSVCFTNDQSFAYSSTWTSNLSAILSRVQAGGGDMLHISRYEQAQHGTIDALADFGGPVLEYANQHAYRAGSKAWAASNKVAYYDEYAHFGARGYWGYLQASPYLNNTLHPTQEGIYDAFTMRRKILNDFA